MQIDRLTDQTIEIYLQIARAATSSSDPVLSIKMLNAAYDQIKNTYQKPEPKTLANLAEMLLLNKSKTRAEEIYSLALRACKQSRIKDNWLQARICDGLTEIYARQWQFEKAEKNCRQAIKNLSAIEEIDPALLSSRLRKLALLNLQRGKGDKARELFQQAQSGMSVVLQTRPDA